MLLIVEVVVFIQTLLCWVFIVLGVFYVASQEVAAGGIMAVVCKMTSLLLFAMVMVYHVFIIAELGGNGGRKSATSNFRRSRLSLMQLLIW